MLTESQEQRLRDALQVLVETAPGSADLRIAPHGRRQTPALVGAVAFVLVLAIFLPLWLMAGGTSPATDPSIPTPTTDTDPSTTSTRNTASTTAGNTDAALAEMFATYWALEGTLESVNDERGWLCPVPPMGGSLSLGSTPVPDDDVPAALRLVLADMSPSDLGAGDAGPACHQPPALVLLAGAVDGGLEATSGIAIRPQLTRFVDACPPPACEFGGEGEEFEMNDRPALLHYHREADSYNLWWSDGNGVPMYAEASGLTRDHLLEVAVGIELDGATGEARADPTTVEDFEPVISQPGIGVWESGVRRSVTYDIDGDSVLISTRFDASADPRARYAGMVGLLRLVTVGDTVAVWIGDHGGFFEYRNADGVSVVIEGSPNVDQAVEVAEALVYEAES